MDRQVWQHEKPEFSRHLSGRRRELRATTQARPVLCWQRGRDATLGPGPRPRAVVAGRGGLPSRSSLTRQFAKMVEESKDEELPLLEAPAPRFGDDACTEDEALDTSVPVAFLTSTRANPDLGYRVPTSASALLATRSQDRAREQQLGADAHSCRRRHSAVWQLPHPEGAPEQERRVHRQTCARARGGLLLWGAPREVWRQLWPEAATR